VYTGVLGLVENGTIRGAGTVSNVGGQ